MNQRQYLFLLLINSYDPTYSLIPLEYYDLISFPDDKPRHGGSYVTNTGSAFESWNFHRYEDGYYGFVETKYTGGTAIQEKANQLHIEKIDNEATGDVIDHVTVIFCAHSDDADIGGVFLDTEAQLGKMHGGAINMIVT